MRAPELELVTIKRMIATREAMLSMLPRLSYVYMREYHRSPDGIQDSLAAVRFPITEYSLSSDLIKDILYLFLLVL